MDDNSYARIEYDPGNLDDVTVEQVMKNPVQEDFAEDDKGSIEEENLKTILGSEVQEIIGKEVLNSQIEEMSEIVPVSEEEQQAEVVCQVNQGLEEAVTIFETEQTLEDNQPQADVHLEKIEDDIACIYGTMRRLERKFDAEILNAENRDNAVKSIYKELNEYKAGLVEKALKNVLYDFIDIREMMYAKVRNVRENGKAEYISLEEFESYADDIGDILERYDVTIYRGEPGVENIAVKQKIVRKTKTEDDSLIKKVAESLSYGYEYNGKVIYPEKINIFVKKE